MTQEFPRALLQTARPKFLLAALSPFAGWVARSLVVTDSERAAQLGSAWTQTLYRALNDTRRTATDPEHVAVRRVLGRAAELANDDNRARLLSAISAEESGAIASSRLTSFELALSVLVTLPDVFELVYARKGPSPLMRVFEFFPKRNASVERLHDPQVQRSLLLSIANSPCRDPHDQARRSIEVEEAEYETRVFINDDGVDQILIDRESGRLGVQARYGREVGLLRRAIGVACFGDADHYLPAAIYTGSPLGERGLDALSTAGVPALERVSLCGLALETGSGRRVEWADDDLSDALSDGYVANVLSHGGRVTRMEFTILAAGAARAERLVIAPPSCIYVHARLSDAAVRGFLQRRGFARSPGTASDPLPTAA